MNQEADDQLLFGASDRIELLATIVMALAAILTAWSAFQAGKWSGIQAIEFSSSNANRVESTRADTLAGQQTSVDVAVFTSWLEAVNNDINAGLVDISDVAEPVEGTLSGFIYHRVRDEFKPAFAAWLAEFSRDRASAPSTPFDMEEYVVAAAQEADDLLDLSAEHRQAALDANQNGDNYVLTTVGFALVIFFAGVSTKLRAQRNRWIMIGLAILLFVAALVMAFSLPIIAPF